MLNLFKKLHTPLIELIKVLTVVVEAAKELVLEGEVVSTEGRRDLSESGHEVIHADFMLYELLSLLILLLVYLNL